MQALLLKQPAVRSFFGIPTVPPKKQPGEVGYVPEPSFSEAFKNVQLGMSEKWEETKEKGEKEAARQKSFADAAAGVEQAPIYSPRTALASKKVGRVQAVSESLTEDFKEAGITPVARTAREEAINLFEEQKRKRAAAVRSRKGKKQ